MRIAIISDTHLSPRAPAFADNLKAAFDWIGSVGIDLVINLGDVTADGVTHADEFAYAQSLMAMLPTRALAVPGNHDIGEALASPRSAGEAVLDTAALRAFRAALGPDRWSIIEGGWQFVGLNAQLYGNSDSDELEQDAWLTSVLRDRREPLGIFLHKPLFRNLPDTAELHQRYLPPDRAAALLARTARRDLRFVVAGHTHQYRRHVVNGVEHIWAPSLAYIIPDALQEPIGEKLVAMMLLAFDEVGHRFEPVVPPGLNHHDLADCGALYPELHLPVRRRGRQM